MGSFSFVEGYFEIRKPMKKITTKQIAIIHACTAKLGMEDALYRDMLMQHFGVETSKALSFSQANACIELLGGTKVHAKRLRYDALANRPYMATVKQLRMLEAMWARVSFIQDNEEAQAIALDKMCERITGKSMLRCIDVWDVAKMVKVLKAMGT